MYNDNPVECLAASVYDALSHRLPDVEEPALVMDGKPIRKGYKRRPGTQDVDIHMFPQSWPNTALGFDAGNGLAGQAISAAYTTVVIHGRTVLVYFAGRYAYTVTDPSDQLYQDIRNWCVQGQRGSKKYARAPAMPTIDVPDSLDLGEPTPDRITDGWVKPHQDPRTGVQYYWNYRTGYWHPFNSLAEDLQVQAMDNSGTRHRIE